MNDSSCAGMAQQRAPPPADRREGTGGGLMGAMVGSAVQGLGFGTGSAMAHRAVDSMFGPREVEHKHVSESAGSAQQAAPEASHGSKEACFKQMKDFNEVRHCFPSWGSEGAEGVDCPLRAQCLENSNGELAQCQFYYDLLQQCRRGQ